MLLLYSNCWLLAVFDELAPVRDLAGCHLSDAGDEVSRLDLAPDHGLQIVYFNFEGEDAFSLVFFVDVHVTNLRGFV